MGEIRRLGEPGPAQRQRQADERNRARLRSRSSFDDQSSVDKIYAWVKETFKSKPMTPEQKLWAQNSEEAYRREQARKGKK